ncbi:MAG: prolyl oligopeptidase family serine peptidase [Chloroflexota bacterium]|nr:prolyl oligopeptidase family serine peptidase [Chloroflexota bacterium]
MTLQRVSFTVSGGRGTQEGSDGELEGVLHLPDGETLGGCAVLHGYGGHPDQPHVVATCIALAGAGIAALRFAYRDHQPPRMTLDTALADTAGAIRLLKAHPDIPERLGVAGFSFGGAVAAITAGRDSRIRAAVLAAAPARSSPAGSADKWKPVAELSRTRARVLLIWGSRDDQVPVENAERYRAVLLQARVTNTLVTIEGGNHDFEPAAARERMTAAICQWVRDSFTEAPRRG